MKQKLINNTLNGRIGYFCKRTPRFLKILGRRDNIFVHTENLMLFLLRNTKKGDINKQFFCIRPVNDKCNRSLDVYEKMLLCLPTKMEIFG